MEPAPLLRGERHVVAEEVVDVLGVALERLAVAHDRLHRLLGPEGEDAHEPGLVALAIARMRPPIRL